MTDNEDWASAVLPWVGQQRWFPAKGVPVRSCGVARVLRLDPALAVLLVEFQYTDRPTELYQVPVYLRPEYPGGGDQSSTPAYIGTTGSGQHLFDAAKDPEGSRLLLRFMAAGGRAGPVRGHQLEPLTDLAPKPVTTEQSNTSVVFGDRYIMKVLRQLWPGRNPDLALILALNEGGSRNSPPPLGWLSAELDGQEYTLATLQRFLRGARMGWSMVQDRLRAVIEGSDADVGNFAAEARAMGVATAQVHATLSASFEVGVLGDGVDDVVVAVRRRWAALAPHLPQLGGYRGRVERLLADFGEHGRGLTTQRIHNDLHLTQVMRTEDTWVLIDFEGEPNASIVQRNRLVPPWRDVACMLRSFDYGAFYLREHTGTERQAQRRVDAWLTETRSAFLAGYSSISGPLADAEVLALRLYELEKALFEVDYEMTYRPDWCPVAVESTLRLLQTRLAPSPEPRTTQLNREPPS